MTSTNEKINQLLGNLDGTGSDKEFRSIKELSALGGDDLPQFLLEKYRASKKMGPRSSCVYHSIRYARSSRAAVELGVEALWDKSKAVRYRACMLLAYSLNSDVIEHLKKIETSSSCQETVSNARAAIDAIINKNSNYFVDREHSGNITLRVN